MLALDFVRWTCRTCHLLACGSSEREIVFARTEARVPEIACGGTASLERAKLDEVSDREWQTPRTALAFAWGLAYLSLLSILCRMAGHWHW